MMTGGAAGDAAGGTVVANGGGTGAAFTAAALKLIPARMLSRIKQRSLRIGNTPRGGDGDLPRHRLALGIAERHIGERGIAGLV